LNSSGTPKENFSGSGAQVQIKSQLIALAHNTVSVSGEKRSSSRIK
jgi:hypothetical protein